MTVLSDMLLYVVLAASKLAPTDPDTVRTTSLLSTAATAAPTLSAAATATSAGGFVPNIADANPFENLSIVSSAGCRNVPSVQNLSALCNASTVLTSRSVSCCVLPVATM